MKKTTQEREAEYERIQQEEAERQEPLRQARLELMERFGKDTFLALERWLNAREAVET